MPTTITPGSPYGPKWKTTCKKAHDKAFKHLDKTGTQVQRTSGKLGVESFWPGPMTGELEKAARILRRFTGTPEPESRRLRKHAKSLTRIPSKLIREAEGLAIFTVFRTGFVWSAAGGSGIVIARNPDRTWGAPSGILVHTLGYGFLAGLDVYDVVLVLRNRKAVNAFMNPKISLGAEITVTAGEVGVGRGFNSGIEATPVLSFVKGKGLYGGIQLDGNIIIERKDENARFYGRPIKTREILSSTGSTLNIPAGVEPLYRAIEVAEGGPDNLMMREADPVNPFADNSRDPSTNVNTEEVDVPVTQVGHALERVDTPLPEYRYSEPADDLYAVSQEQHSLPPEKMGSVQSEPQVSEETRADEGNERTRAMEKGGEKESNDIAGPHPF